MPLRVAGAQIPVTRNLDDNLAAVLRAVDFAADEQADILLTPEGSLSGYTHDFDPAALEENLRTVVSRASGKGLGLALGTCCREPEDGRVYNQVRFYTSSGVHLGSHCKILLCGPVTGPAPGAPGTPGTPGSPVEDPAGAWTGEPFATKPLQVFRFRDIPIGGLLCNDLWANPGCTPMPDPHLTQRLSDLGARIIFHAVNGGRSPDEFSRVVAWQYHESNLRMRARAGGLWIVTVDSSHPTDQPCSAPSGVVDPDGNWAVRVPPQGERFFAYTIGL